MYLNMLKLLLKHTTNETILRACTVHRSILYVNEVVSLVNRLYVYVDVLCIYVNVQLHFDRVMDFILLHSGAMIF